MPLRSSSFARLVVVAFFATAGAAAFAACDQGPPPAPAAAIPGRTVDPASTWVRGDFGAHPAATSSAGPASTFTPDPLALADLLRAVPTSAPGPTDPDGGTLIGTDAGPPTDASPVTVEDAPLRTKKSTVLLGPVAVQAEMASPAIEREARAQLYFPLVTRCRDKDAKILPADAIFLEFKIDESGYIVPQSISATAQDAAYKSAAECMRRELGSLPFRGPAGARGQQAQVKMTVPSID